DGIRDWSVTGVQTCALPISLRAPARHARVAAEQRVTARPTPLPPSLPRFQDGGTVRRGSIYIERRADHELYRLLLEGEFCYVLRSEERRVGKEGRWRGEEQQ